MRARSPIPVWEALPNLAARRPHNDYKTHRREYEKALTPAMFESGTLRQFPAPPKFGRYRSTADINGCVVSAKSVEFVESRGGISPPRAPKTVREPLDSHGSRCSAVSMTWLPISEARRL